jgi:uncharacterized membrane protein
MIAIGHYTFPYFTMFYIIAFLTSFVVLIVEGRMRNFPVLPWLGSIALHYKFGKKPVKDKSSAQK